MKAVVLAAGRGTRLLPLTSGCPKPMIPVAGRPLLEHILLNLREAGLREVMAVTGHLAEQVEGYFGDGKRLGLDLRYRHQPHPTGSGMAALLARDFVGQEPFLLTFTDILTDPAHYHLLLERFHHPCQALLGLNWMEDPAPGAAVYRQGERVVRIVEKPPPGTSTTNWNNAGAMILTPSIFPILEGMQPSQRGEVELPVGVGLMVEAGMEVYGVEFPGFWCDVGRTSDLEALEAMAKEGNWPPW